jgi:hypothetical protein
MRPFAALFIVLNLVSGALPTAVLAMPASVPLVAWSDPATWDGAVPAAGDVVSIPEGRTVLLDVSPPPLGGLTIDGALIFADQDLDLQTEWIVVRGRLQVGTPERPFIHRAVITLRDDVPGSGGSAASSTSTAGRRDRAGPG